MILMIMAAALMFAYVSSDLYATQALGALILKLPLGKWGIIILINILLLVLGCFIPPAAVILMVAPLLLPIITGLGFDPVWFAVIMTVNLEIGLVTPPVGLNLYIVKKHRTGYPHVSRAAGSHSLRHHRGHCDRLCLYLAGIGPMAAQ